MKRYPETPALDAGTDFSGHVWVQELPTGGEFRFQVAASGLVTVATADRTFDAVESVPLPFRRAAQLINERLDREALQAATGDPGKVTFCGIATWNDGVEYEWDSLQAFVGTEVWSGSRDAFLPPDAVTRVFERLGLPTVPAIEKELPAAHADFSRFDDQAGFPQSEWHSGEAAGVLIRDKSGGRAQAWRPERNESQPAPEHWTAEELAAEYATEERIGRIVAVLRNSEQSVTIDTITDRLVADVAREAYVDLYSDDEFIASSVSAFQSAVAERVQQHQFNSE